MVIRRAILWWMLLCSAALAQSNPGFVKGQVPTAAQWNSYFTSKTDTTNGTLVNPTVSGASQWNGTISGTPSFLGNVTFSGAAIFSAGGTLSGTFGGTPTASGAWTFGNSSTSGRIALNGINAGASVNRVINWQESGVNQWQTGVSSTNSGSNVGNDWSILAYDDAGSLLGAALTITRSTRKSQFFGAGVTVPSLTTNIGNPVITNGSANGMVFNSPIGAITGSHSGGLTYHLFANTSDNSTTGGSVLVGVSQVFGGANFSGGATALNIGQTMNAVSPGSNSVFYTAFNISQTASADAGGTNTGSGSVGNLYGLNLTPGLSSGATNYTEQTSAEIDSYVATGASTRRRVNLKLALQSNHSVQGAVEDSMLDISMIRGAGVGAKMLIALGSETGLFAADNTSGVFIGHRYGSVAVAGFDPKLATYIDAGDIYATTAMWNSPGAVLDGAGNWYLGPGAVSWTAAGLSIDASGQTGGVPTVTAGGSGALTGQIVTTKNGDLYTVTAAAGVITALAPIVNASSRGAGPGAAQTVYGDGITGATATIPWTNAKTLSLGATNATAINIGNASANVVVGSGSALATNATSGLLQIATMAGAPTGTVGAAGKAAIVIDTTNKKVCYTTGGGTWECSAAFTP